MKHIYSILLGIITCTGIMAQNAATDKPEPSTQRGQFTSMATPDSLIIPGIDQKLRNPHGQDKTDTETIPAEKLQGGQPSTIRRDD